MCNNNPYLTVLIIGGSQRILHPDLSHSPVYPLSCKVYREEVQVLGKCYWTNTTESSHLILFLKKIPERNCYEIAVLELRNWVFVSYKQNKIEKRVAQLACHQTNESSCKFFPLMFLVKSANTIYMLQIISLCQWHNFSTQILFWLWVAKYSRQVKHHVICNLCVVWDFHEASGSLAVLECGSLMKTAKGWCESSVCSLHEELVMELEILSRKDSLYEVSGQLLYLHDW